MLKCLTLSVKLEYHIVIKHPKALYECSIKLRSIYINAKFLSFSKRFMGENNCFLLYI